MYVERQTDLNAAGLRIGIAVSRYHDDVTEPMCEGAVKAFTDAGGSADDLVILPAAGAYELPVLCKYLTGQKDLHGVVAIGCVIRGDTTHDQYICEAVSQGLTRIALDAGKPVGFGLLTCHTKHQARERAGGEKGNKGEEAMAAVIETIQTLRSSRTHQEVR